ncbi:MAG: hydroxyacylglutathione hydrolase [Gammaproteobacteria bacterium]|nr:hydroxyacylglutathione hydrolase [Gammaproteobacteria bacterium]
MLEIERIPALSDNYIWLVHEPAANVTAVVDPAEAEPVRAVLRTKGWRLTHILNTHHHADHVGGNAALKSETGATIVGPRADRARIPGIDVEVGDGDSYVFGAATATVFDVPGHTRGHIAYWFAADDALFCGDTLFAMGCGRLFEGTPAQMWHSLSKLRALPPATRVYCAHEYTLANGRFALSVEPDNAVLAERMRRIEAMRARGEATVPSTLGVEIATNPFLRPDSAALRSTLGLADADDVTVFAETRRRKDGFRG